MVKLKLEAMGTEQQSVLNYLQENASETLAEKINNGVYIEKDGNREWNKKDLKGFLIYACEQAQELEEKNAKSACLEGSIVCGWAIHFFEEDSIEGTLFNDDGTEYKKVAAKPTGKSTVTTKPVITQKKAANGQVSIFDIAFDEQEQDEQPETEQDEDENETEQDDTELCELETAKEQIQQVVDEYANVKPFYKKYCELKREYLDCIVMYRLGDFYEMFDNDAEISGEILDLTITGRDVGLKERVALTGIPYHAVDKYVEKLSAKHKVLVFDNDNEQYLIQNGQKIDVVTGETMPAFGSPQQIKQATPPVENNPHICYLQSLVNNLRADV